MAKKNDQEQKEVPEVQDNMKITSFHNVQRITKGEMKVIIDTFKLEVATFKKNIAPNGKGFKPMYIDFDHCHIFHTRTEKGKENIYCAPVGGHTHEVTIKVVDGRFVGVTSPPIQNKGSEEIAPKTDYQGRIIDNHTHQVTYLKSDEHEIKANNPEAVKVFNALYSPNLTPSNEL